MHADVINFRVVGRLLFCAKHYKIYWTTCCGISLNTFNHWKGSSQNALPHLFWWDTTCVSGYSFNISYLDWAWKHERLTKEWLETGAIRSSGGVIRAIQGGCDWNNSPRFRWWRVTQRSQPWQFHEETYTVHLAAKMRQLKCFFLLKGTLTSVKKIKLVFFIDWFLMAYLRLIIFGFIFCKVNPGICWCSEF